MKTQFRPMLACNAEINKLTYPLMASPKLDGVRCCIRDGQALSRTLKRIPNGFVRKHLNHAYLNGLDGELIVGDPTSRACYRTTVSGVMSHEGEPAFTFYVFDLTDYDRGFQERFAELGRRTDGISFVERLPHAIVYSAEDLAGYESRMVAQGYEGVILRDMHAPYKFGRSTVKEGYMLKVKRFVDGEAEIIGFEEEMFNANEATTDERGYAKRSSHAAGKVGKGTLGAFLVRDATTGVEFSVGTGLTADERALCWTDRHALIGELIKYKSFEVGIKDKPRHPTFLGFRDRSDT